MAGQDNDDEEADKTVFIPKGAADPDGSEAQEKGEADPASPAAPDEGDALAATPAEPDAAAEGSDDPASPSEGDERTVFVPLARPGTPADSSEDDQRTVFVPRDHPAASDEAQPPAPSPASPQPEPQTPSQTPFSGTYAPPPNPSAFPNTGPAQASLGKVQVGDYVNVFRIERFIARGGMGEVYEAVNPHPPFERVAVKIMLPDLASDENVLQMFYKEAGALGRLHHENIVQYRIASQGPNGQPYMITEFVDGPSLESLLGKFTPGAEELRQLTRRLASGLAAAHAQGVVHRDIAPDNILLVENDPAKPKIIDFGIVKDTHDTGATIIGDGFAGKLRYVAPEQLGDYNLNVGPWTDIYSLALTMLAVASGKHADMGGSIADAVMKRRQVPDLSPIPDALRHAFTAALQPDPADRPQSMADFAKLLDSAPSDRPEVVAGAAAGKPATHDHAGKKAAREKSSASAPPLASKKWLLYGGGGALAAILLLVVVVVLVTSPDDLSENGSVADGGSAEAEGGAQIVPGTPAFEQVALAAIDEVECAWLTYDGASGGTVRYSGGAARPGAAQNALSSTFAANGVAGVSIDMSDIVTFGEEVCPMIEALREFRSEQPITTSPQSRYELEMQENSNKEQEVIAKPIFKAEGLVTGDEVILIWVGEGEGYVFAGNRKDLEATVRGMKGAVSATGFEVPIEVPDLGGQAFGIVTGQGPFPDELFPKPKDNGVVSPKIPVSPDWARRFREEARQKKWRTDLFWYRITDDVPN